MSQISPRDGEIDRRRNMMPPVTSFEDAEGLRCIDIVERDDGTVVIRECRRDPEAGGRWSIVGDYSGLVFATKADAIEAAKTAFPWLARIAN
jgi:hypothetical protein